MKTVFDMMSGDREWALSDPKPETEPESTFRHAPPELALRLMTVDEALYVERHRQTTMKPR